MTKPGVSTRTTQRIDRLLRSLVGVADVRMVWNAHGLRSVHILRDARTQPHQLIRNIVSGLHAGFSIQVLPTQVHIHDDAVVFEALAVVAEVLAPPEQENATSPELPPSASPAPANGGHANGGGAKAEPVRAPAPHDALRAPRAARPVIRRDVQDEAPVVARPSHAPSEAVAAAAELIVRRTPEQNAGLRLERIDVERRGGMLRCRTVLALGDHMYSAIAEVPDSPSAEAELAARVAVDALRAGGLTTAMLEGVGFITIAKTNYCVATVRESGSATPRASAAPLIDSMAASATAAVLTALGSFTDARAQNRARAGH